MSLQDELTKPKKRISPAADQYSNNTTLSVLVINLSESSVIPITRDHIVKIVLPGITQLIVGLDSGPENLATLRTHSSHS